ncbi:zinc transport system substrate-binding protein [Parabacteroides sp. PFB2-10]|uniref:metal ABC transporter solute-binding protein, Zn/Mn family n=1 Tax=Parabacteroides sp. PFB2-10 TaxID=1742405 RepID=UPI00247496CD|nr:zinc ABC transporter substrate-binding protein [Parabacteroides sp. PFB2-10]MDH6311436.1 zinc transport system substrate-binding protein [Parabacteroides sp. PFB2-10]MDL2244305.1 zinc ABC transporter substrate-binding protein [Parabacteroides sp. OttesenSCG-928-J18]
MKPIHFLLCVLMLVGCKQKPVTQEEQIISVSIEPQRYFAEKIAGDRFVIHTVVPTGQSPETYDPTAQQMVRIGESLAYFQIGPIGFEQAWIDRIKQNNPQVTFFDLSQGMGFLEGEEHGHDHASEEGGHEDAHHHHGATDPHIWSSMEGARLIARNMLEAFVALDAENSEYYQTNYNNLMAEIDVTETTIAGIVKPLLSRTFIIYHPALSYFAEEFHLKQLCIEMDGKEPSPVQLKELVDTAVNHNVQVVFIQEEFDQKNAELIARETRCRLVRINPLAYDWSKEMIHIAEALAHE